MPHKHHDHPSFDRTGTDQPQPKPTPNYTTAIDRFHTDADGKLHVYDPNATHPVDGVPTDGYGFLAFLRAGVFTDVQLAYLRAALPQYEGSPATHDSPLALTIVDEWQRVLVANP